MGADRARRRPADDRARRVDREHRAPLGAGGPRDQQRRPAVGRHGLHAGLRRPAAARRPDRRLHGSQAHVHHRPARVRRRLRPRWPGRQPGAAVRGPRTPGRVRRTDGPGRPVPGDRHVHRAQGARQGVRRVRCAGGRWRRDRADRRRRADGVRLLALVPGRQRPGGDHRGARRGPAGAREQGARRHAVRRPGGPARDGRAVLAGVRVHRGRPGQAPRGPVVAGGAGLGRPQHGEPGWSSPSSCWSRSSGGRRAAATRCSRSASSWTGTGVAPT